MLSSFGRWCLAARVFVVAGAVVVAVWLAGILLPGTLAAWGFSSLGGAWGVVGRAEQVRFNPFTLTLEVRGLQLAALLTPDEPFLTVEKAVVDVPWSILLGRPSVESIDIESPVFSFRRSPVGFSNLPVLGNNTSSSSSDSDRVWKLGTLSVNRAMVLWEDVSGGPNFRLGPVSLLLNPVDENGLQTSGRLAVPRSTSVAWATRTTRVEPLEVALTLSSNTVSVHDFVAQTPEGRFEATGEFGLGNSSSVEVDYVFNVLLGRVSAWFGEEESLGGDLRLAGWLKSEGDGPIVSMQLDGPVITWDGLELTDVSAVVGFDGDALTVDELTAGLAGGVIQGKGAISLTGKETTGNVAISWQELSAEKLSEALLPDYKTRFSSTLYGSADVSWSGHSPKGLVLKVECRHVSSSGTEMPATGMWHFDANADRWMVSANDLFVGALGLSGEVIGSVPETWSEAGAIAISGNVEAHVEDLGRFGADLTALGFSEAVARAGFTGEALLDLGLSGTVSEPGLRAELVAAGRALGGTDDWTLRSSAELSALAWRLNSLNLRIGESDFSSDLTLDLGPTGLRGGLSVRVPDLEQFASLMPSVWHPAGSLKIDGSFSGDRSNPRLEAELIGQGLSGNGQQLPSLTASLAVSPDLAELNKLVVGQGDGQLEASVQIVPATGSYTASLTGRGFSLAPWIDAEGGEQPFAATVDLDLDSQGLLADPRGTAHVVFRDLVYRDYVIDHSEHVLTLEEGVWNLRSKAPALAAEIELQLGSVSPWDYELHARLLGSDLGQLNGSSASLAGRLMGQVTLDASAVGNMGDLVASEIVVEVAQFDARVAETPVTLSGPVRLRYGPPGIQFEESIDLQVGDVRLVGGGALLVEGGTSVIGNLTGDLAELPDWLSQWVSFDGEPAEVLAEGQFGLNLQLTGRFEEPELEVALSVDNGVVGTTDLAPVTEMTVRAVYGASGLRVNSLSGLWQQTRFEAEAKVPESLLVPYLPSWLIGQTVDSTGPVTATATVWEIGPDVLSPFGDFASFPSVRGSVDAEVSVAADRLELSAVDGAVTLRRLDLTAQGVSLNQQLPTRLAVADGRLVVDSMVWQIGNPDTAFSLDGHINLVPEVEADLTLTGVADLNVFSRFLGQPLLAGDASLEASLRGPLRRQSINAVVGISGGEMRLADPRLLVSDLTGDLVFDGTTVRTTGLVGTANGGDVRLVGDIHLSGLRPDGTLKLVGSHIPLEIPPGVRTELDADMGLSLSAEGAELSGLVTILHGDYREPVSTAGSLMALMESQDAAVRLGTESSVLDELRLNIAVRTEESIRVDNNYGAGSLVADLRLGGSVEQLGVAGRVTVEDGGQVFLGGNTFEIEAGTMDFNDPDGWVPELDLSARTEIGDEEITVTLQGTFDALETTMRSSSNLSESDIVSLLLTGRTLGQVGSAPVAAARDRALGLVSGELLGAAGRSVGLDSVRLDPGTNQGNVRFDSSLVAGEANPGTRLTVGKHLNRQIELVASQNLRESGLVTWIVNYLPRRNLELRLVVDDETDRSYELRHALTFGQSDELSSSSPARSKPRVTTVRFVGDAGLPESELRELVGLQTGDSFDFLRWQDGRDRIERYLWEHNFHESRVRTRRVSDLPMNTVALEFEIDAGSQNTIDWYGYEPTSELLGELEALWGQSILEVFLVEEVDRLVRRHLVGDGYLRPNLTVKIQESADGSKKQLMIDLDLGARSLDRQLLFVGQEQMALSRVNNLVTPGREADAWAGGDELVKVVVDHYRAEGFLEARAVKRMPEFNDQTATLRIEIFEGPVFRVGEMKVEGSRRLAAADVTALAGLTTNFVYDAGLRARLRSAVLTSYRTAGFNAVRVRLIPEVNALNETVSLVVSIDEGRRQVLGEVEVDGGVTTRTQLIEEALQLTRGDPVDPILWGQARQRLYDTGAFRSVDILPVVSDPVATNVAGEDQLVTARLRLEEWPRYRFRYGLQLIDEQAPLGEIDSRGQVGVVADITRQNFLGRAISLGSAVRYDSAQRAARGFIAFPSFFGRKVRSNLFVSRVRETFGSEGSKAEINRQGLTFEQKVTPSDHLTLAYSYSFDRNHAAKADLRTLPPVYLARFNTSLIVDSRNDVFNATQGWFHSSSLEWGTPTFGSDRRFFKYVGQQNYFRPFENGVVLASALRIGAAASFGRQLIFSERFFAGGGTTVRGYLQDELGPRDSVGHPVGGQAVVVLNQEVRFPAWRMFRGVGFFDAGNVFRTTSEVSLGRLQVATGLGVRVDTPVGLFRVDYGLPLTATRPNITGRWFVSLGQAF